MESGDFEDDVKRKKNSSSRVSQNYVSHLRGMPILGNKHMGTSGPKRTNRRSHHDTKAHEDHKHDAGIDPKQCKATQSVCTLLGQKELEIKL